MSSAEAPPPRILAIYPISRGFGFGVLEGPTTLVDWGIRNGPNSDLQRTLRSISDLIDLYRPEVIVSEDHRHGKSRRRQRTGNVIDQLRRLETTPTRVRLIPAAQMRAFFGDGGAITKHRVASIVAEHFPELAGRLPPPRRPWMSQDSRMAIFDAVGFGLTYFLLEGPDANTPTSVQKNAA